MALYLEALLLGLLGLVLFHFYTRYNKLGRIIGKLPGPPSLPILGNLLDINCTLVRLNELLREWGKVYYPVYRIWFGWKPLILISHPDDLEIILSSPKHIDKKFAYQQFYPWLKTGLLTSIGKKWQQRRKILTPAFHFNILKKYMDITNEQCTKAMEELRSKDKETKHALWPLSTKYTLNIICESAMGVTLDSETEKGPAMRYKEAVYRMGSLIIFRTVRPYMQDWMLPFIPKLNKETKEVLGDLNGFTDKIIRDRRQYHESTNFQYLKELEEDRNSSSDNIYLGKKKRLAMLDLLLSAEKNNLIDDDGIKEEVATFIFEGHDTTAMSLIFTILLLSEYKDVQDLAREEIEQILSAKGGQLDTSHLQQMNYLERCIKESLRLYPSVPTILRHLTEDVQLKNCFVPKNNDVFMNIIDVHRDPNFWPDPEKFDPDRFLPDNIKNRHPYAYIPFSAGPRNCIGQKFAMMELKALIANILYNFRLDPIDYAHDVKIQTDAVIRPSHPVYTKFIRIDRR